MDSPAALQPNTGREHSKFSVLIRQEKNISKQKKPPILHKCPRPSLSQAIRSKTSHFISGMSRAAQNAVNYRIHGDVSDKIMLFFKMLSLMSQFFSK
jgi:hypothetical protein